VGWSGSQWVGHYQGLPTGLVQVSKLEKPEEATAYARQFGFKVRDNSN
jgi:hypothetical protein